MDFSRTHLSRDSALIEQNFVNYLSLFPHADTASHKPAVRASDRGGRSRCRGPLAGNALRREVSLRAGVAHAVRGVLHRVPRSVYRLSPARRVREDTTGISARKRPQEPSRHDGRRLRLRGARRQARRGCTTRRDRGCCSSSTIPTACTAGRPSRCCKPMHGCAISSTPGELTVLAVYSDGDRELWGALGRPYPDRLDRRLRNGRDSRRRSVRNAGHAVDISSRLGETCGRQRYHAATSVRIIE